MFWFSNVGYIYSFSFVLVAFLMYAVLLSITIREGKWTNKVRSIVDVQPQEIAVIHGRSTVDTPYEWEGKKVAFFYDYETKEMFPKNGMLQVQDDSGILSVYIGKPHPFSLKEYTVLVNMEEPEQGDKKVLVIENNIDLYCRGIIDKNGTMKYKKEARQQVLVQTESFEKNVREEKKIFAGILLFIFIIFQAYPFYAYQKLWNTDLDDVIKEKWTIRNAGHFTLENSEETVYVTDAVYEACEEGAKVHKASQSLNLECGLNPESRFMENQSFMSQVWTNSGGVFVLFISIVLALRRED